MLIDMHAHTSGISRCCKIAAPEMLRVARNAGIDGVVLCNHYQSCYVSDGDFDAFARRYVAEYELTKAAGDAMDFPVFFGIEVTMERHTLAAHMLVYGVGTDFVFAHPKMFAYTQEELWRAVHAAGGILVQAHPWRKEDHLLDIRYLDGIEVSCHPLYDGTHLAGMVDIATKHGLLLSCGGDFHNDTHRPKCGVYLPNGIENTQMLAAYLAGAEDIRMAVQEVDERRTHNVIFRRRVGIISDVYEGENDGK